ncbi:hypothetical protein Poly51_17140 [Rubripirellula tenax]|uniref:Uncharacterized protein n=1 Tax=Rubripirellula tenax TaxID=2528015 RepID=A0A5C6FFF1_9BACT|nr:hypothetical protein [Rubripirellula tenax]TWU58934.1 hypothetical protein Poly51_17140 [Rubripirellula tenax]
MPLLKLWNTLRGRSASSETETVEVKSVAEVSNSANSKPETAVSKPSVAAHTGAASRPASKPTPKPARSSMLGIFGSSGPHASLCKQIKALAAPAGREIRTVLEINVEDGSRAIAVLGTLANQWPVPPVAAEGESVEAVPTVRYIVIDQFEMAGGETTLKQFHQTLRGASIRPQVYPEPIDRGLVRVAHTIGAVDLILVATAAEQWQDEAMLKLISRVSHSETTLLYRDGDTWKAYSTGAAQGRRAA